MIEVRFEDLSIDESPPTISYVLLAMLATIHDFELEVHFDVGEEWVVVRDVDGNPTFRIGVSPMMGRLLLSILDQTGSELTGVVDEGW